MKRIVCLASILLLAACGSETGSNASVNNSSANNGSANNDGTNNTSANNVAANNGTPNNGTPNNGTPNNGTPNNLTPNNQTTNNSTATGYTWHKDARAVVEANCTQCHYYGGIGPFPLTTYEEVQPLAALIESVVDGGIMPPWPPADGCGDFKYERKLDPEEKEKLLGWIDNDTPEGNPDDYVEPAERPGANLGQPDYVADIGTDYAPNPPDGGIDDYHCFIIEHDFSQDRFMNAFGVRPGNDQAVHHVLFWQIEGSRLEDVRSKEPSPGAGYECFGGNGTGEELGLLGGWVPGTLPVQFGDGEGLRIPSDSFIVVQIHYNTVNDDSPDRTNIDMWFTDGAADTPLAMYPLPDTGLYVPAGDANGTAGASFNVPIPVTVYGVVPHMHLLGTRIRVQAGDQCLVDIPEWDFNWQGFYLYETPIQVSSGTDVQLECWYDNSAQNQPDGRSPEDVRWGEGTYDEMCLNYFIIEEIPYL